jgi:hypothetical protein
MTATWSAAVPRRYKIVKAIESIERVILTAWVGGLWAIGYLAAPVLFKVLDDRRLAGELAGHMFKIIAIVGLICGVVLVATAVARHGTTWLRVWRAWLLLLMIALVAAGIFVLQPMIQEVKALGLAEGSEQMRRFGMLHGVSSVLYLITSVCGLVLVAVGLAPREPASARPS